jgi:hypothetical protein
MVRSSGSDEVERGVGRTFDQMEKVAVGILKEEDAPAATGRPDGFRGLDAIGEESIAGLIEVVDTQGEVTEAGG